MGGAGGRRELHDAMLLGEVQRHCAGLDAHLSRVDAVVGGIEGIVAGLGGGEVVADKGDVGRGAEGDNGLVRNVVTVGRHGEGHRLVAISVDRTAVSAQRDATSGSVHSHFSRTFVAIDGVEGVVTRLIGREGGAFELRLGLAAAQDGGGGGHILVVSQNGEVHLIRRAGSDRCAIHLERHHDLGGCDGDGVRLRALIQGVERLRADLIRGIAERGRDGLTRLGADGDALSRLLTVHLHHEGDRVAAVGFDRRFVGLQGDRGGQFFFA